jgi:hypothetical protein
MLVASLAKKARKGLVLVREPSGRLSRSTLAMLDDVPGPGEVKRLRDAALMDKRDAEWGTEIGRLYLTGKISGIDYAAGKRWARLSTAARKIILAPKQAPVASTFVPRPGGHPPDPDSDKGRDIAAQERLLAQEFAEAHGALIGAGMLAERAVRATCEEDRAPIGHSALLALRNGLGWLALHWGLTQFPKNGRRA